MLHFRRPRKSLRFSPILGIQTRPFTTLSSLLGLCKNPRHLKQIHARFVLHGLSQNPQVSAHLIDGYADFGLLHLSQQVFQSVVSESSVVFCAMLRSSAKLGEFERTIVLYREMVAKSVFPDEDSYPFVLRSYLWFGDFENAKRIHGILVKLGLDSCRLVDSGFGSSFWNSLISEAVRSGNGEESFRLFRRMRTESVEPDSVTVISLLRSSVVLNQLNAGKCVHGLVLVTSLCGDMSFCTALLSMYAKLGDLESANRVFGEMPDRDCAVWNIMISANSQNGFPLQALQVLRFMGRSGIRADIFTALPVISSIAKLKDVELGEQVHAHVIRNIIDWQVSVHNSLIDMYCECDRLSSARKIFDSVTNKTLVSWSAIIKGYVTHERSVEALSLFSGMKTKGIKPDFITIINVLPACVNIGALENVKYLHGHSIKSSLNSLSALNTALLVSYAKCGCIEMSQKLFDEGKVIGNDIIMWNSMIGAYAKHGNWQQCFEFYDQMKQSRRKPDSVTFLAILTACVNSGLVKEGKRVFREMKESFNLKPNQEHYACMVDLLGRSGNIEEARELVKSMPFEPDARIWGPLLSACKMTSSETGLAEFAAEKLITMEPKNAGNYVLLSNIYASAGKWDKVARMRSALRDKGLKKTPGLSWLEINGRVHEFSVADQSHPNSNDIYRILGHLELEVRDTKKDSNNREQRVMPCSFETFVSETRHQRTPN